MLQGNDWDASCCNLLSFNVGCLLAGRSRKIIKYHLNNFAIKTHLELLKSYLHVVVSKGNKVD
jgi:hypothetical protein